MFVICLTLGGVFLAASVLMYFIFRIPDTYAAFTGMSGRKPAADKISDERLTAPEEDDSSITQPLPEYVEGQSEEEDNAALSAVAETVPEPVAFELGVGRTAPLVPETESPSEEISGGNTFVIIEDTMIVHTSEIIA